VTKFNQNLPIEVIIPRPTKT